MRGEESEKRKNIRPSAVYPDGRTWKLLLVPLVSSEQLLAASGEYMGRRICMFHFTYETLGIVTRLSILMLLKRSRR